MQSYIFKLFLHKIGQGRALKLEKQAGHFCDTISPGAIINAISTSYNPLIKDKLLACNETDYQITGSNCTWP